MRNKTKNSLVRGTNMYMHREQVEIYSTAVIVVIALSVSSYRLIVGKEKSEIFGMVPSTWPFGWHCTVRNITCKASTSSAVEAKVIEDINRDKLINIMMIPLRDADH